MPADRQTLKEIHERSIQRFQSSWGLGAGPSASAPKQVSSSQLAYLERQQEKSFARYQAQQQTEQRTQNRAAISSTQSATPTGATRLQTLEAMVARYPNVAPSIHAEIAQLRGTTSGTPARTPITQAPPAMAAATEQRPAPRVHTAAEKRAQESARLFGHTAQPTAAQTARPQAALAPEIGKAFREALNAPEIRGRTPGLPEARQRVHDTAEAAARARLAVQTSTGEQRPAAREALARAQAEAQLAKIEVRRAQEEAREQKATARAEGRTKGAPRGRAFGAGGIHDDEVRVGSQAKSGWGQFLMGAGSLALPGPIASLLSGLGGGARAEARGPAAGRIAAAGQMPGLEDLRHSLDANTIALRDLTGRLAPSTEKQGISGAIGTGLVAGTISGQLSATAAARADKERWQDTRPQMFGAHGAAEANRQTAAAALAQGASKRAAAVAVMEAGGVERSTADKYVREATRPRATARPKPSVTPAPAEEVGLERRPGPEKVYPPAAEVAARVAQAKLDRQAAAQARRERVGAPKTRMGKAATVIAAESASSPERHSARAPKGPGARALHLQAVSEHLSGGGTSESAVKLLMEQRGLAESTAKRYAREAAKTQPPPTAAGSLPVPGGLGFANLISKGLNTLAAEWTQAFQGIRQTVSPAGIKRAASAAMAETKEALSIIGETLEPVTGPVRRKTAQAKQAMENRYGKAGARAIMGAATATSWGGSAVTGFPIPTAAATLPYLAAAEAAKLARRGYNAMGGGGTPPPQGPTPALSGSAAGGSGLTMAMGANVAMAVYAGIKSLEHGLAFGAQAMNTSQRTDLTDAQKRNQIADSVPVVGGLLKSLREFGRALDGTTESMRQNTVRHQENLAVDRVQAQVTGRTNQIERELGTRQARHDATSAVGYAPLQTFDRQTVAGRQQHAEYQRLLPLQDRHVELQREEFTATRDQQLAQQQLAQATDRQAVALRNVMATEQRYQRAFRGSDPRELQLAAHARERASQAESAIRPTYDTALGVAEAASSRQAQARSAVRRNAIDEQRAQLGNLEDRYSRTEQGAATWGAASPIERSLGLSALRQVREHGERAGPEAWSYAQRFAPEYAREQQVRIGEESPERMQAIREGFRPSYEATPLREQDRQIDNARADIRVNVNLDAREFSRHTLRAFREVYGEMIQSLQAQVNEVRRNMQAGRAVVNSGL